MGDWMDDIVDEKSLDAFVSSGGDINETGYQERRSIIGHLLYHPHRFNLCKYVLTKYSPDIYIKNFEGRNVLFFEINYEQDYYCQTKKKRVEIIRMILERDINGVLVRMKDNSGHTPKDFVKMCYKRYDYALKTYCSNYKREKYLSKMDQFVTVYGLYDDHEKKTSTFFGLMYDFLRNIETKKNKRKRSY